MEAVFHHLTYPVAAELQDFARFPPPTVGPQKMLEIAYWETKPMVLIAALSLSLSKQPLREHPAPRRLPATRGYAMQRISFKERGNAGQHRQASAKVQG